MLNVRNASSINCVKCGNAFTVSGKRAAVAKYCSMYCYLSHRWQTGECPNCKKNVSGRRFCSDDCRIAYWGKRDPERRQTRRKGYWQRKLKILEVLGGKCVRCGNSDIRVLDLDHIDPDKKNKPAHRNYPTPIRVALWEKEMDNLQILCANCHRIKTHEETWKTEGMF